MNVTLGQLRAFERIVRLGSFHAAARELDLSQPSVSQRIRELEEVARHTPLFIRRGPRVSLTAEGHALIEYADRLLGTAGEMVERFRTRDPLKGMLRLGVNESFALICLPDLLQPPRGALSGRFERRCSSATPALVSARLERPGARHRDRVRTDGRAARVAGAARRQRVRVVREHID